MNNLYYNRFSSYRELMLISKTSFLNVAYLSLPSSTSFIVSFSIFGLRWIRSHKIWLTVKKINWLINEILVLITYAGPYPATGADPVFLGRGFIRTSGRGFHICTCIMCMYKVMGNIGIDVIQRSLHIKLFDKAIIPRIGCVAWQNRSKTRSRNYIPR